LAVIGVVPMTTAPLLRIGGTVGGIGEGIGVRVGVRVGRGVSVGAMPVGIGTGLQAASEYKMLVRKKTTTSLNERDILHLRKKIQHAD
jgi:hypothetical protein